MSQSVRATVASMTTPNDPRDHLIDALERERRVAWAKYYAERNRGGSPATPAFAPRHDRDGSVRLEFSLRRADGLTAGFTVGIDASGQAFALIADDVFAYTSISVDRDEHVFLETFVDDVTTLLNGNKPGISISVLADLGGGRGSVTPEVSVETVAAPERVQWAPPGGQPLRLVVPDEV